MPCACGLPLAGVAEQTWRNHTTAVFMAALSPDGTKALSGSFDQTLKYWDISSGMPRSRRGDMKPPLWSYKFMASRWISRFEWVVPLGSLVLATTPPAVPVVAVVLSALPLHSAAELWLSCLDRWYLDGLGWVGWIGLD